jgi:hypothetical protein
MTYFEIDTNVTSPGYSAKRTVTGRIMNTTGHTY